MRLIDADELIVMEYGGIKFVPKEFIDEAPTVDAVPLGEELWMNKFNIRTRGWRDADGNLMGVSFVITRKEAEDVSARDN